LPFVLGVSSIRNSNTAPLVEASKDSTWSRPLYVTSTIELEEFIVNVPKSVIFWKTVVKLGMDMAVTSKTVG